MAKNQKSKIKKKITKIPKEKVGDLMALAHRGTEESLKKISDFTETTKGKDLKAMAKIAKDEAEFFYYSPKNEAEEKDLLLAKMIWEKEDRLWELESRIGAAEFELEKLDLDRAVFKKLLKKLPPAKQKDWQYNFSEDYYLTVKNRQQENQDKLECEVLWLKEAKAMIKNEKYLSLPLDFFRHYHWDYEDADFWEDDNLADRSDELEEPPF